MPIATFTLDPKGWTERDGFAVYDNALLFRAGDYPDHAFSITPGEMAEAAAAFAGPLGGNIEHTGFLKGRACSLDAVRIDPSDPALLRGVVKVPVWLNAALGDHEKKLSTEWRRDVKRLDGLALCINPAIPEAALISAFTEATAAEFAAKKARTGHGRMAMQSIHDVAASAGAYCDGEADDGEPSGWFVTRSERSTLQKIHDHAVSHGAACRTSKFAADPQTRTRPPAKGKPMPLFSKLKAFFTFADPQTPEDEAAAEAYLKSIVAPEAPAETSAMLAPPAETADFTKDPVFVAQQKRIADLESKDLRNEAAAWADAELKANRALPAERAGLVAAFVQAALDDRAEGATARFSAESAALGADRVAALKARQALRPAHTLYDEAFRGVPDDGDETAPVLFVLPNKESQAEKKADPKEVARLASFLTSLPAQNRAS
jgi:hypothetical protein